MRDFVKHLKDEINRCKYKAYKKRILRDIHNSIKNDTFIVNKLECFLLNCKTGKGKTIVRGEFLCGIDVGNPDVFLSVLGNRIDMLTIKDKKKIDIRQFMNTAKSGSCCCVENSPMQFDMDTKDIDGKLIDSAQHYKIIKKKTEDFRSDIKKYMTGFFKQKVE